LLSEGLFLPYPPAVLYRLDGVSKSFGPKNVLAEASWQHDPGRVVGLVGRNGAGKSTVLRLVAGVLEPDSGRRLVAGGTTFASLDQAVEPEGEEPLRAFVERAQDELLLLEREMQRLEEAISAHAVASAPAELDALLHEHDELRERFERAGGYEAGARVERVLDGVGLPREAWKRRVGELSGGQKHRAQIARLLLSSVSVLLLDEPTNHLDVDGMEFLETWLRERKEDSGQAALVVSHDRAFLNSVADAIVEVAHGKLEEYPGDYDTFRKLKAERDRLRAKEAEQQRKYVERTEEFIRRNIAGQKTKQAQGRRKMLARIERIEAPREDANEVTFRFEEARQSGGRVLEAKKIVPGYDRPLLPPVSFLLRRGERVALWGPNGCGKTTLLKTLARQLPPLAGSVVPGAGVLTGYYDQEMSDLPHEARLLDVVMDLDPTMREGEARDFLALFDFRGDDVEQRIGTLSGGEKGRLSLARIVFGGANLLLLDEPTNHLDLDARERLEEALSEFEGAIVFVSHDRWFVDRIATHVLEIGAGGVLDLEPGGYTDMLRRRKELATALEKERKPSAPVEKRDARKRPDRALERRREKDARRADELLEAIGAMETSLKELELLLAEPDTHRNGEKARALVARRQALSKEIAERVGEWEETQRRLDAQEAHA
jgi:ATP-binding cassette subfamily F protein 3